MISDVGKGSIFLDLFLVDRDTLRRESHRHVVVLKTGTVETRNPGDELELQWLLDWGILFGRFRLAATLAFWSRFEWWSVLGDSRNGRKVFRTPLCKGRLAKIEKLGFCIHVFVLLFL